MKNRTLKNWTADRSWIPCSLTVGNGLCGLFAIIYAMNQTGHGEILPRVPILFLFIAMILDALDGFAARKLQAESLHGMQLDSLSDLISFGLAPAILVFTAAQGSRPGVAFDNWLPWMAAGCYTICAMWRLAHYNTLCMTDTDSKEGFSGLPSPAAALTLCSVILLMHRFDPSARSTMYIPVAYSFVLSFLMVSEFQYLHIKQLVKMGSLPLRLILLILILLTCRYRGLDGLLLITHLYVLSAPLVGGIEKRMALIAERNGSVEAS